MKKSLADGKSLGDIIANEFLVNLHFDGAVEEMEVTT